jgi:hypothetical protein
LNGNSNHFQATFLEAPMSAFRMLPSVALLMGRSVDCRYQIIAKATNTKKKSYINQISVNKLK